MDDSPAIQDFYADADAHCYGCGRLNREGFRIRTRENGSETLTEFVPAPFHTALPGSVYGGLIASLIDCHSTGSAAIFAIRATGGTLGSSPTPRFVTAHLAVDYLAPTPLEPLQVAGRLVEMSGRKAIVESDLRAGGTVTARGRAILVRLVDRAATSPRRAPSAALLDSGRGPT